MDSVKRCKKVYCPKFLAKSKKIARMLTKKLVISLRNKKLMNKAMKKTMSNKNQDKKLIEMCVKGYCNPSCKDTLFEAGTELPKSIVKQLKKGTKTKKNYGMLLKFFTQTRKNIFGMKKDVLVKNFYNKLPKKQVEQLIKDGALSGCSLI